MGKRVLVLLLAVVAALAVAGTANAAESSEPGSKPKEEKRHVVVEGESLSLIADQYKLNSWRPLWNVNTDVINPDIINIGASLIVPEGPTEDRPLPEVAPVAAAPVYRTQAPVARRVSSAANYAPGSGGLFASIRQRESGGNYATNTGNGYYGAYQFDLGTWRGVGGTGLPSDASPAEQDARAAALYARRGCSPWPNTCR